MLEGSLKLPNSYHVKGKLPFGFSYQANFSPRYDFLMEFNHQSALNPTIAAKKGIVDRRDQTTYSWQSDNILRWNQTYKKHTIEATFLFNAEKSNIGIQNCMQRVLHPMIT